MTSANIQIRDNNAEISSFGFPTAQITAANHDTIVDAIQDVVVAVGGITLGEVASRAITHGRVTLSTDKPTNDNANREIGVRFTLAANGNQDVKTTVTLPAPDLSLFPFVEAGTDLISAPFPTLSTELTLLIDTMEAAIVHPLVAGAMTVIRMEKIGRNL